MGKNVGLADKILAAANADPAITASGIARDLGCSLSHAAGVLRKNGIVRRKRFQHGHSWREGKSPTYRVWVAMKRRCLNPKCGHFRNYGGRGITICPEWVESFEAFLRDMGERPSLQHSIDRINVNGNYEPGNCRWATVTEQHRNRRDNRFIQYQGQRITVAEFIERLGVPGSVVRSRLNSQWSVERIATTPYHPRGGTDVQTA